MIRVDTTWRLKILSAMVSLLAALSLFLAAGSSLASAQSIMRSPSLSISRRVPTMPRIDPNLAGRAEPETRSLPVATMAAEKPAGGESRPDMSQTKP